MADTAVERRNITRFFCHRCNIEFEDVLQEFLCPYCAGGFIEQLEGEPESSLHSGDDTSDADMSHLDDSDDMNSGGHPMLHDLAFLMTGGRGTRGLGLSRTTARPDSLLEQLVWTLSGGGPPGTTTGGSPFVLGGSPFVLVGAPGDYVFGGEGLDAVVTQLLGQLENSGPPPLPRELIDALPSQTITAEQVAASQACSVCWENFQLDETVSRLECEHIFHSSCIAPWLQLHATCPICRRSLAAPDPGAPDPSAPSLGPAATPPPAAVAAAHAAHAAHAAAHAAHAAHAAANDGRAPGTVPRVLLRRLPRRLTPGAVGAQAWDSSDTSSTSLSAGEAAAAAAAWGTPRSQPTSTNSDSSVSSADRTSQYNMDIDFD